MFSNADTHSSQTGDALLLTEFGATDDTSVLLVAGTPLSYGYDTSTSTFTLAYSTKRADGTGVFATGSDSTVAVPAVQYPSGYQVVVSGAKVVSEGGTLTLASCSGATKVTLTVAPGSGVTNGC